MDSKVEKRFRMAILFKSLYRLIEFVTWPGVGVVDKGCYATKGCSDRYTAWIVEVDRVGVGVDDAG